MISILLHNGKARTAAAASSSLVCNFNCRIRSAGTLTLGTPEHTTRTPPHPPTANKRRGFRRIRFGNGVAEGLLYPRGNGISSDIRSFFRRHPTKRAFDLRRNITTVTARLKIRTAYNISVYVPCTHACGLVASRLEMLELFQMSCSGICKAACITLSKVVTSSAVVGMNSR